MGRPPRGPPAPQCLILGGAPGAHRTQPPTPNPVVFYGAPFLLIVATGAPTTDMLLNGPHGVGAFLKGVHLGAPLGRPS